MTSTDSLPDSELNEHQQGRLVADLDRRLGHAPPTSLGADEIRQDLQRLAVAAVR